MEFGTTDEIKIYKGVMGGKFSERASFQRERDQWIVGMVGRYQMIAAEDLAALIGFAATPQGTENAYRLLTRLKEAGEIQLFTQYGTHYAVSMEVSLRKKGAKAQFPHRALESKRRMALDQVMAWEAQFTGEQLREKMRTEELIPDGFGRIGERGWFFEDETGSHTVPEMVAKGTQYHTQLARLQTLFNVKHIQVVWSLKVLKQVLPLVKALHSIGQGGDLFLVTNTSIYDLRRTEDLTSWPMFFSPLDKIDREKPMPQRKLMENEA